MLPFWWEPFVQVTSLQNSSLIHTAWLTGMSPWLFLRRKYEVLFLPLWERQFTFEQQFQDRKNWGNRRKKKVDPAPCPPEGDLCAGSPVCVRFKGSPGSLHTLVDVISGDMEDKLVYSFLGYGHLGFLLTSFSLLCWCSLSIFSSQPLPKLSLTSFVLWGIGLWLRRVHPGFSSLSRQSLEHPWISWVGPRC